MRRQQARKARVARRRLQRNHDRLPKQVRTIFDPLEPAFSRPIHRRFVLLALAAILTLGGRTITNLLRVLGILAPGHPSSYHRVFSRDRWSLSSLARRYVAAVLARFVPAGTVLLAGDDTVTEHPGPHVYGKGRHRDPVRSTHTYTAFRWGHKWVVLTVLVPVPWATRRWALPLLVALYRPKEENLKCGRRHKTPAQLLGQMVRILKRWFPDRTFVVTADGGYASHELAELASRIWAEVDSGQLVLPQCQPGRATAAVLGQRTSSEKGERSGRPCGSRREDHATTDSGSRLVWWGPTPCRGRDRNRTVVQEGLSPGEFALGLRLELSA